MKTVKKIPERMCVSCKQMKPKTDLVRLVLQADGTAVVDLTGKLNGRGVYLCKCRECVEKARKNKSFAKHNGFAVTDGLVAQLENVIEQ